MRLLLGTRNKGKIHEFQQGLAELPLSLISVTETTITEDPEETGETYDDNALLKARFYHGQSGLPTIADDSGIVVDALQGELGVKTRRWGAGINATDQEWIAYFLKRMEKETNRNAHFVSVIAFIDEQGKEHFFRGICKGIVTQTLEADYLPGLPLRGCFRPLGFDRVLTHLSYEEERDLNHRYVAVGKLKEHLQQRL